jgi:hypothetical protein
MTPSGSSSFSNCFVTTSAVIAPWGITVDAKNTTAYITDLNTTTYSCPINSDGTYSACALYTVIASPTGIAMSY